MSLDVWLQGPEMEDPGTGILVRIDGYERELTRGEWLAAFPGWELVDHEPYEVEHFEANITGNLHGMASAAGIGDFLWKPDKMGVQHAEQLIEPLTEGLARLRTDPDFFRQYDSSNKWGTYDQFVPWVERYLAACVEFPKSRVRTTY